MTELDRILEPVRSDLRLMEQSLAEQARADIPLLDDISGYALNTPGKRVRPAMLLLAAKCAGRADGAALGRITDAAAVVEYIHTATLLHDDVVDHADLRRKKRAARTLWGNKASVLVGDYLFTMSFQKLAAFNDVNIIAAASDATTAMAQGEILQLTHTVENASLESYMEIIKCKTSVLFALSARLGAYLGGGAEESVDALHGFGLNFGHAFQITDDVLDYWGDAGSSGKSAGADLKERKATLPLIELLRLAPDGEKRLALDILAKDEISDEDFGKVRSLMVKYSVLDFCLAQAEKCAQAARRKLESLPESVFREKLAELLAFSIARRH